MQLRDMVPLAAELWASISGPEVQWPSALAAFGEGVVHGLDEKCDRFRVVHPSVLWRKMYEAGVQLGQKERQAGAGHVPPAVGGPQPLPDEAG